MGNSGSKEDTTIVVETDDGVKYELIVEKEPFAEGVLKHAYKARMISPRDCDIVVKTSKDTRTMQKDDWDMDVKMAKISEELAKAFNEESGTSRQLHFRQPIPMKVITSTRSESQFKDGSYVLVEAYLEGEYTKWNSNYDYVNEEDVTSLQAFSHFTYKKTNGKLIIVDIQGVKDTNQYSLTDPAIHSDEGQYGSTDLGKQGMEAFFKKHKCEEYCSKLQLQDGDASESVTEPVYAKEPVTSRNGDYVVNRNDENTMLLHGHPDRIKRRPQHSSRSEKTKFNPQPQHQAATSDPSRPSLEARTKAEQLKTEGNKAYKDGDLQLATRLYSKALQHAPGDHAVYSNRSMAYGRLQKYEKALKDAEMVVQLKPDWLKGFYRKGDALLHLKKYADAVDAYKQGWQLDPKNQDIKKALSRAGDLLLKQRMSAGIFGGEHAPPKPPTEQEKEIERYHRVMENLQSQSTLNALLRTGNALGNVPAAVRKALENAGLSEDVGSEEELPTSGTYIIHQERIRLPDGSIRILSLHVRLEFIRETVTTSTSGNVKTTKTTRYYRITMEWK